MITEESSLPIDESAALASAHSLERFLQFRAGHCSEETAGNCF